MGLLNLRNALMAGKRKPTAKDYTGSPHLAFDGIENDGYETHNPSLNGWRDLISNNVVTRSSGSIGLIGSSFTWGADGFITNPASGWAKFPIGILDSAFTNAIATATYTVECVVSPQNAGTILQHPSTATRFQFICETPSKCYVAVVVSNGTVSASYINGVQSTNKDGIRFAVNAPQATARVIFGGWYEGSTGGVVHRGFIYGRALTAAEIAANYKIDKARFGLP